MNMKSSYWVAVLFGSLAGCSMIPGLRSKPSSNPAPAAPAASAAQQAGNEPSAPRAPHPDTTGGAEAERQYFDWPRAGDTAAMAKLSPWQRGLVAQEAIQFGEYPIPLAATVLDLTPDVSMTQRLAYVAACLHDKSEDVEGVAVWAMCAEDAKALDRKRFQKEIADLDAETKQAAIAHFNWAVNAARARQAEVDALAKEDPGLGELGSALPARARKEWSRAVKASGTGVGDALAAIDAWRSGSKKTLASACKPLWPHIAAFVKSHSELPSQLNVLDELPTEPTGNLLTLAFGVCYPIDARSVDVQGPRVGARTAILQAIWGNKIEFDQAKRSARDVHSLRFDKWPEPRPARSQYASRDRGIIESVEPKGAEVLVTFKPKKVKYSECVAHKETNKLEAIKDDGTLVYRTVCTKWEWKTTSKAPDPATLPAAFAAGLAPGRYLEIVRYQQGTIPVSVHATDDPDSPVVARSGVEL